MVRSQKGHEIPPILIKNRVRVWEFFWEFLPGARCSTKFVQAEVVLNCFSAETRGLEVTRFYMGRLCLNLQSHTLCIPFLTERVNLLFSLIFQNDSP